MYVTNKIKSNYVDLYLIFFPGHARAYPGVPVGKGKEGKGMERKGNKERKGRVRRDAQSMLVLSPSF